MAVEWLGEVKSGMESGRWNEWWQNRLIMVAGLWRGAVLAAAGTRHRIAAGRCGYNWRLYLLGVGALPGEQCDGGAGLPETWRVVIRMMDMWWR